jgi:hypothetical protein
MCDDEIDFMVLSAIIFNNINSDKKINPNDYSLKMLSMMTIYNFIDILKNSDIPHKDNLYHIILNQTNQVFDILLMEGSIKPIFDEEPEYIKEYANEISQKIFKKLFEK